MNITIYALVDPRTPDTYRYIGQTSDITRRHFDHCRSRLVRSSKEQWIESLRTDGVMPQIVQLETVEMEQANERERYWQEQHRSNLTNDGYMVCKRVAYREPKQRTGKLAEARDALERSQLIDALEQSHWNITKAANALGVCRPTMYNKIDKMNISRPFTG